MRKLRLAELIGSLFPGVQGQAPTLVFNGALPDQTGLSNAILSSNPWQAAVYNVAANTAAFTATPGQIMGAEQTYLNLSALAGAAAVTLPTVANLIAALTPQQAVVGSSVVLRVLSSTASAATLTTNTGWTLTGTVVVAANTWRDYIVTLTNVGTTPTATLQSVGAGVAP